MNFIYLDGIYLLINVFATCSMMSPSVVGPLTV